MCVPRLQLHAYWVCRASTRHVCRRRHNLDAYLVQHSDPRRMVLLRNLCLRLCVPQPAPALLPLPHGRCAAVWARGEGWADMFSEHGFCQAALVVPVRTFPFEAHISPDAKWPYPAKPCFSVIMNFYDWFIILDTYWVGIRRMPAWHPWGIFLEGKNKMVTQQSVLGDVFTCKPDSNTILVYILMFSGSRNPIMMK